MFISRISKIHLADSDEDMNPCAIPELTFRVKVHKKVLQKLVESRNLIFAHRNLWIWESKPGQYWQTVVTVTPLTYNPHLEKGNQDQIVILNMILEWIYPNGRENHVVLESSHDTVKNQNSTNELPNMPLDSKVIENEAPKNDMITVDLKTQDTN